MGFGFPIPKATGAVIWSRTKAPESRLLFKIGSHRSQCGVARSALVQMVAPRERPDSGNSVLEPTLPPDFLKSFSDELASFDEANEYVIDKYGSMGGYGDFLDEQLSSSFLRKLETELDWNLPGDQPGEGSWAQTAQVLSSANMTLEAWPERFR